MPTLHGYRYFVVVNAESREQAEQVMAERINYEEDYGFPYTLGYYKEEA